VDFSSVLKCNTVRVIVLRKSLFKTAAIVNEIIFYRKAAEPAVYNIAETDAETEPKVTIPAITDANIFFLYIIFSSFRIV